MTLTAAKAAPALIGHTAPRIAPPLPIKSLVEEYERAAHELGIVLLPWQKEAARYITAVDDDGNWLYREVCILVARQNGKSWLLLPRILMELDAGRRILHTAQDRVLPRIMFEEFVGRLGDDSPRLAERGVRMQNGTETVRFANRGFYRLVAPRHGVRGHSTDLILQDEVREQKDESLKRAMLPTNTMSPNPQVIYLSNAGEHDSVVLNSLRRRMEAGDPRLCYLEWSAGPERSVDDREGWAEANPALGYMPNVLENLEDAYVAHTAGGSTAGFETEHLCRWVISSKPRLVSEAGWQACRATLDTQPIRPVIGFSMAADSRRASAVMAWQMTDGRIACVELLDVPGDPIDVPRLGKTIKELCQQNGVKRAAYASWTDKDLAEYVPNAVAVDGKDFATASEGFVRAILSGRLAWDNGDHISNDLAWTARKPVSPDSGAWSAVPDTPERSITAVLAAIRAVGLASAPPPPAPRIG